MNSKKIAPVPSFQGTPARLLIIQTVGEQSEENSGEQGLVFAIFYCCQEKLMRASAHDHSESNGTSTFVVAKLKYSRRVLILAVCGHIEA